jgi:hypothetical protein
MNEQNGMASRFKQALQEAEQARDPKPVASLFSKEAELTNLGGDHGHGAEAFWRIYLDQFREVRSEFTGEVVSDHAAALEWQSQGTTAEGKPVEYRGLSVIEFDGKNVTSFRTYYDSAVFVRSEASAKLSSSEATR